MYHTWYITLSEGKHNNIILRTLEDMLGQSSHLFTSSPSQPVIAGENIICWGTFLKYVAFFAPQAQHCTAQSTRTSSEASTLRSERDNASKQTELARAGMASSIYITVCCVLMTNEEIQICPAYQSIQPFTKQRR